MKVVRADFSPNWGGPIGMATATDWLAPTASCCPAVRCPAAANRRTAAAGTVAGTVTAPASRSWGYRCHARAMPAPVFCLQPAPRPRQCPVTPATATPAASGGARARARPPPRGQMGPAGRRHDPAAGIKRPAGQRTGRVGRVAGVGIHRRPKPAPQSTAASRQRRCMCGRDRPGQGLPSQARSNGWSLVPPVTQPVSCVVEPSHMPAP
eukprot:gene16381-biopygen11293